MRGLKKVDMKRGHINKLINRRTLRLLERIGQGADSLKNIKCRLREAPTKKALLWIFAEPPWPAFPLYLWTSLRNFFPPLFQVGKNSSKGVVFGHTPYPFLGICQKYILELVFIY